MVDHFQQSIHIIKAPDPPTPPVNSAEAIDIVDPFQAVADVLDSTMGWTIDNGFQVDWTAAEVRGCMEADLTLTVEEGRYDELENIGKVLSEAGFSWWGIVHPKYEYLGVFYAHTPELGDFQAECDDDANVIVPSYLLIPMIDEAANLNDLKTMVHAALGKPWTDTLWPQAASA